MSNLLPWLAIVIGFVGLVWSADRFVDGSAAIATNFGVPKLFIGLTVVAFGTSAPEIVVSISSALRGAGEIAIGNAIGSNLANVGMVLGITALIAPLPVKGSIIKQEVPIMLLVMLIAGWFIKDGKLTSLEGLLLVALVLPLLVFLAFDKKDHPEEQDDIEQMKMSSAVFWFALGLGVLVASAEILVWGATKAALSMGVSPLIIGLTIVAVGTSLPELAASIISTMKGHHDIAIGNVIGSNIFNLLLVMGIPAIIQPLSMVPEVFSRDYLSMIAITLVLCAGMLFSFLRNKKGGHQSGIGRPLGMLLLLCYGAYYALLFLA